MPASVASLIICDFAQVREGLLFVQSGLITRVYRPDVPAPMGVCVAVVLEVPPTEINLVHEARVRVKREGAVHVDIGMGFQIGDASTNAGEAVLVPVALDLRMAALPEWGCYDVQASVDDKPGPLVSFWIEHRVP